MTENARIFDFEDVPDDRPLLLLDVDGVINVFNGGQRNYIFAKAQTKQGTFPLKVRVETRDLLARLGEHFHLVWCTMWNDEANDHIGPVVGLPVLPYIPCFGHRPGVAYSEEGRSLHPKVHSISEFAPGRALAWVDDEIGRNDISWADTRNRTVAPTYLEKTDERQGLIDHHVKRLVTWAMSLKEKNEG